LFSPAVSSLIASATLPSPPFVAVFDRNETTDETAALTEYSLPII